MIDIDAIKQQLLEASDIYAETLMIKMQIEAIMDEIIKDKYVAVELVTGDGNIVNKLKAKYGWACYWKGQHYCCGTNILLVPNDKCTKALLAELQEYDPYLGGNWQVKQYPTID